MNDDLQSFIEPELEARLVALILGEASAFEVEELERILKERPEVALAKQRLEEIHGLIGQAMVPPEDDDEWKLTLHRRGKVLAVLGEGSTAPERKSQAKERRISIAQWRSIYATAACLMVAVVVLALVAPSSRKYAGGVVPELVSYSAEEASLEKSNLDQKVQFEDSRLSLAEAESVRFDGRLRSFQSDESLQQESEDRLLGLEKKRESVQSKLNNYFVSNNEGGENSSDRAKAVKDQLAAIGAGMGVSPAKSESLKRSVGGESLAALGGGQRTPSGGEVPWGLESGENADSSVLFGKTAQAGEKPGNEGESVFGFNGIPEGVVKYDWAVSSQKYNTGNPDPVTGKPGAPSSSMARAQMETPVETQPAAKPQAPAPTTRTLALAPEVPDSAEFDDGDGFANGVAGKMPALKPRSTTSAAADPFSVGDGDHALSNATRGAVVAGGLVEVEKEMELETATRSGDANGVTSLETRFGEDRDVKEEARSEEQSVRQTRKLASKEKAKAESDPETKTEKWSDELQTYTGVASGDLKGLSKDRQLMDLEADGLDTTDKFANDYLYLKLDESSSTGKVVDGKALLNSQGKTVIVTEGKDTIWGSVDQPIVKAPQAVDKEESEQRTNADFISPVERTTIPGIPAAPNQEVSGIATAGLRSGASAVNRNSIDGIINSPEKAPEAGNVASGNLVGQELVRRQEAVRSADTLLLEGRKSYAEGDYETAVQKYRASLDTMPFGSATSDRREVVKQHLQDGSVALSQQHRRVGKYDEARDLLEAVVAADPGSEVATKGLEYLDDPIRTNPSASYENTKNVDKVRRNLYKGNGYYDLGLYDKAEEEFKEVLRTDPYNKAARRWLEKTAAIKSDYYRAAYDETRARMLTDDETQALMIRPSALAEDDRSWEQPDPMKGLSKLQPDEVDQVRRNLYTGEGYYDLGLYDKAEEEFREVLRTDPYNKAARRWMEKSAAVKSDYYRAAYDQTRAEMLMEVDKAWELAVPPINGEELRSASIASKPQQIVIPVVDFENTTLEEVLDFLRIRSIELDVATLNDQERGIDFVLRPNAEGESLSAVKIPSLKMKDAPISEVLEEVAKKAGLEIQMDEWAIVLKPESENSEEWTPEVGRDGVSKEADAKLAMTNLPVLDFNNTTLSEGLDFLNIRSQELSGSENAGVEFTFEDESLGDLIVDKLYLSRVPLNVASKYLAEKTGTRYRIKDGKVVFYSDRPIVKKKAQSFETLTSEKTDSTFSLNVSDVSFKLAKSSLAEGKWPEAAKVRPEEFVNALDYDDRKPSQSEKVACEIEQGAHPFMQQRNLMRVSMSTAALGRNASTPLRLTILLDQSGSMERADRAESVKRAFALLTAQLNAGDEVTLVGFARTPRLLAERVKGNESGKLLEIVSRTLTEGGTNLEGALASGIQLAKQQYVEGAQNRIILLTDGAANLGDALPANLAKQVEQMRQADIAFDACGVGADGLNDDILSSLTKQGDGRYYFLDRPEDADEGFARQIAGALRPAAKNVKVQVIFNPKRVSKFKLYGFEKHLLKKEDFRNDTVDAAEMAAEESGVALYHFEALPDGEGDVGHVSVRFLDTATDRMVERTWPIPYEENVAGFSQADPAMRLASTAALFAEKLKGSPVGERVDLKQLRKETDALQNAYSNQLRFQEFRTMLRQAGE